MQNLAIAIDAVSVTSAPMDGKIIQIKERIVRRAIAKVLKDDARLDEIFELVKAQSEY